MISLSQFPNWIACNWTGSVITTHLQNHSLGIGLPFQSLQSSCIVLSTNTADWGHPVLWNVTMIYVSMVGWVGGGGADSELWIVLDWCWYWQVFDIIDHIRFNELIQFSSQSFMLLNFQNVSRWPLFVLIG